MDIKQLGCFLAVCEEHTFTKAAHKLFLTQQCVSKTIASLEKELGFTLFYRTKDGLIITEYGAFLEEKAQSVVDQFDNIRNSFQEFAHTSAGCVNFGMAGGMIRYISLDLLNEFRKKHPYVQLEVKEILNIGCEAGVLDETLDIAATLGPFDNANFKGISLKKHNMLAIINVANPLAKKATISIDDLRGQRLVSNEGKNHFNLIALCQAKGFFPNIISSINQPTIKIELCEKDDVIAFGVDFVLERLNLNDRVCFKQFDDSAYQWEMCLITKRERHLSHPVTSFLDFIVQSMETIN
ncbi:MAG: LysR family transcriptional regulator [Negativicutes bacterium]